MLSPTPNIHPEYLAALQRLLGGDYPAFAACLSGPPSLGLRLNTLKIGPLDFSTLWKNQTGHRIPWCPAGYLLSEQSAPGKHPYHAAGLYYLGEPSAQAAPEILAPRPGERLLDLCAAPGGKAAHLAALMQNQGLLVANEIHPGRAWELAENLERCGVTNAALLNETPGRLADHFGAFFDRVLVDAPCSGEGMFRKSAAARRAWSPELVRGCALRQGEILRQAARLVRPGGWLVYSTCTFNPHENEEVVGDFLAAQPGSSNFRLEMAEHQVGFSPGRPDWMETPLPDLERAVRLWPHRAPGEGHFIALLRKEGQSLDAPADKARRKTPSVDPVLGRLFGEFCQASLKVAFDPARLAQVGSYLYRLPEGLPDLSGLKALHPGWWLGAFKKERFEPAHALALGLRADQAQRSLDFAPADPRLPAYLRGETLLSPGEPGWLLVCVDGFPLGWGKRLQGVVKNYYPRGLRAVT